MSRKENNKKRMRVAKRMRQRMRKMETEANGITKQNITERNNTMSDITMNKEIVLNLWHVVAEKDGALYVIGFLGKEYELEGNDDEKLKYLTAKASTDFDCPTVNIPVPNTYIMADATSGAEMKGVIPFSAFNVMPMNFKIRAYEEVISAIEEKCNIKISDDPLVCTTPIKLIDGVLTRIPIDKVVRTGS